MGDSTVLTDIPLNVQVAAVYRNGLYAVTEARLAGTAAALRLVTCS
jgi:hypothetical protein